MQGRDNHAMPLAPDFGKGMLPVVDYFEWIDEVRRRPLWFWEVAAEPNPVSDELEKRRCSQHAATQIKGHE
jgi:hypothetical protein